MYFLGFLISLIPIISLSICYKMQSALLISFFGILIGLLIEYSTLCEDFYEICRTLCFSSLCSYFCFIPGKSEHHYILIDHISIWPYMFLLMVIIIVIALHDRKTLIPLNEGITFIYTALIYYWFYHLSSDWSNSNKTIVYLLMLIPTVFTLINAFTYIKLHNITRFLLSLWNTLIIIIFSISFITSIVIQTIKKGSDSYLSLVSYSSLFYQYILLGLSGIYLVNNFILITGFLPNKSNMINGNYFGEVKEIYADHLYRYSSNQIEIKVAFLILSCIIILLGLLEICGVKNYNFVIWTVILTYSIVKKIFNVDELTSRNF